MPLKGAVLKSCYPQYGMREFADYDILIDGVRAGDVKDIMESLGYSAECFGMGNHDVYYKQPVMNFEMHSALFGVGQESNLRSYYDNVEERLLSGKGYEKKFLSEDGYLYMIAHEYKHYSGGGTGLRSLLDTYLYLKKMSPDMQDVIAEAEKVGLREFEEQNRSLAIHLFGTGAIGGAVPDMLSYVLSSGTYGTMTHRIQNKMSENGWGKIRYMLDRWSVPISRRNRAYAAYAVAYPVFYRNRIILPFLPFYRIVRAVRSGRFLAEVNAIRKLGSSVK